MNKQVLVLGIILAFVCMFSICHADDLFDIESEGNITVSMTAQVTMCTETVTSFCENGLVEKIVYRQLDLSGVESKQIDLYSSGMSIAVTEIDGECTYLFSYTFDELGNPMSIDVMTDVQEHFSQRRIIDIANQYSDGVLVSIQIDTDYLPYISIPVYSLLEHYIGYRDVNMIVGSSEYSHRGGRLVWQRDFISGLTDYVMYEYEYENNQLVREDQSIVFDDTVISHVEQRYNSLGQLISINGFEGETESESMIEYDVHSCGNKSVYAGVMITRMNNESNTVPKEETYIRNIVSDQMTLLESLEYSDRDGYLRIERFDERGNRIYYEMSQYDIGEYSMQVTVFHYR